MRKRIRTSGGGTSIAAIGWIVIVLALTVVSIRRLSDGHRAESRAQLERSLRRAAVACYSVEGIYPPTLDYLREHYGVQISEDRFRVDYSIFADNIMPDIEVLDKDHE